MSGDAANNQAECLYTFTKDIFLDPGKDKGKAIKRLNSKEVYFERLSYYILG